MAVGIREQPAAFGAPAASRLPVPLAAARRLASPASRGADWEDASMSPTAATSCPAAPAASAATRSVS